mmetsp:Transcript_18975/g.53155  ORF Transcript_18975/g.53155 Transcript_18975/m.53155 type:complete len:350 (+) Transcript_18975:12-1061(+)
MAPILACICSYKVLSFTLLTLVPPSACWLSWSSQSYSTARYQSTQEDRCTGEQLYQDEACWSACTKRAQETSLTQDIKWGGASCQRCHRKSKKDAVFDHIEAVHGNEPWGAILDAGTGPGSFSWISSLPGKTKCDAVTASPSMMRSTQLYMQRKGHKANGAACKIHLKHWVTDGEFMGGQLYDNIILDYFIGAVDGFEAFTQESIFEKLGKHLAPNGRLWIIGLEPILHRDVLPKHISDGQVSVVELRDAAIALSGERPYREFPLFWYRASLERIGMKHTSTGFANVYGVSWASRQLRDAHLHLDKCKHKQTCKGLREDVIALEARLKQEWGEKDQCFGMDFVIVAQWK